MEFSKADVDNLSANNAWRDIKERLKDVKDGLIRKLIDMDLPESIEIRKIEQLLSLPETQRAELKEE